MAVTINADTSNGLVMTPDTSGEIKLQSAGTDTVTVNTSGNVGIGTSSPTTKLTINHNTVLPSEGAILNTGLWNVGADSTQSVISLDAFNNIPAYYGRRASGTAASPTATTSESDLLLLAGRGHGATGYISGSKAMIRFKAAETWTDTASGTYISFNTTPTGSTTVAERMRIDASGNLQFDSGYGSFATAYGCRAWVQFFGTGTVSIRGSGNVSSVTDNAAGTYTINFSTAMPDTNYSWSVGSNISLGSYTGYPVLASTGDVPALFTTSAFRIHTVESSTGGVRDVKYVCLSFFR
jgi:hypothetical protein